MKTIYFKYTDAKGKVSHRTVVVASEPTDKLSGTDISELEAVEMVAYVEKAAKLKADYLAAIEDLNKEFDLKFRFRQFFPDKMEDVVIEN